MSIVSTGIVNFLTLLTAYADACGLDVERMGAQEGRAAAGHLMRAAREVWREADWPGTVRIERRYFAREFDATAAYVEGDLVRVTDDDGDPTYYAATGPAASYRLGTGTAAGVVTNGPGPGDDETFVTVTRAAGAPLPKVGGSVHNGSGLEKVLTGVTDEGGGVMTIKFLKDVAWVSTSPVYHVATEDSPLPATVIDDPTAAATGINTTLTAEDTGTFTVTDSTVPAGATYMVYLNGVNGTSVTANVYRGLRDSATLVSQTTGVTDSLTVTDGDVAFTLSIPEVCWVDLENTVVYVTTTEWEETTAGADHRVLALALWDGLQETMADTLSIWDKDPETHEHPGSVGFHFRTRHGQADDVIIDERHRSLGSVWVRYRVPPPEFTSALWASGTSYAAGDKAVVWPDCYVALQANSGSGQGPASAPARWEAQRVPERLLDVIAQRAAACWLRAEGKYGQAAAARGEAESALDGAREVVSGQMGQSRRYAVANGALRTQRGRFGPRRVGRT